MQDTPTLPNPADPALNDRLLELYIAGECTSVERRAVERWIAANPGLGNGVRAMRMAAEAEANGAYPPVDVDAAERQLVRRIKGDSRREPSAPKSRLEVPRKTIDTIRSRYVMAAAFAAACVLFGITVVPMGWFSTKPSTQSYAYATPYGKIARISLANDVRVILAPASRLVVSTSNTPSNEQHVTLVGEAYFVVPHTARRPFTVRAGTTLTRVLGTAFGVRYYAGDERVRVSVTDGKVVSQAASRVSVILSAGMIGHVTDSTAVLVAGSDVSRDVQWTRGHLAFDEVLVPTMLADVGRWYGYEFRIADSALARSLMRSRVTTTFESIPRDQVLSVIRLLLRVSMTIDGNIVTLRPETSSATPSRREARDFISPQREIGR